MARRDDFSDAQGLARGTLSPQEKALTSRVLLNPKQLEFNVCTELSILLNSLLPPQINNSRKLPWIKTRYENGSRVQLWYGRTSKVDIRVWRKFMGTLSKTRKVALHSFADKSHLILVPFDVMKTTFDSASVMDDTRLNDSRAAYCILIEDCPKRLAAVHVIKEESEEQKSSQERENRQPNLKKELKNSTADVGTKSIASNAEAVTSKMPNDKASEKLEGDAYMSTVVSRLNEWILEGAKLSTVDSESDKKEEKEEAEEKEAQERDQPANSSQEMEVMKGINPEPLAAASGRDGSMCLSTEMEDVANLEDVKDSDVKDSDVKDSDVKDSDVKDSDVKDSDVKDSEKDDLRSMLLNFKEELVANGNSWKTDILQDVLDQTIHLVQEVYQASAEEEEEEEKEVVKESSVEHLREKHLRDARKRASRQSMRREITAPITKSSRCTRIDDIIPRMSVMILRLNDFLDFHWDFLQEVSKTEDYSKKFALRLEEAEEQIRAELIHLIRTQTDLFQGSSHLLDSSEVRLLLSKEAKTNALHRELKVVLQLILCASHTADGRLLLQSLLNKKEEIAEEMKSLIKHMGHCQDLLRKRRRDCPRKHLSTFDEILLKSSSLLRLISDILDRSQSDSHLSISSPLKPSPPKRHSKLPKAYRSISRSPVRSPRRHRSSLSPRAHHSPRKRERRPPTRSRSRSPRRFYRGRSPRRRKSRSRSPRTKRPQTNPPVSLAKEVETPLVTVATVTEPKSTAEVSPVKSPSSCATASSIPTMIAMTTSASKSSIGPMQYLSSFHERMTAPALSVSLQPPLPSSYLQHPPPQPAMPPASLHTLMSHSSVPPLMTLTNVLPRFTAPINSMYPYYNQTTSAQSWRYQWPQYPQWNQRPVNTATWNPNVSLAAATLPTTRLTRP
ncbi:hypothetical protein CAPTEDRAFT_219776 [Capitella teleta]|uniref:Uncharacterized protein n=1 Tax=Capitella teleta TaxID=283909 RepID=R7V0N2_CAPTE|nr:hypothetical protein CAPTEDRAFT_219776 [Capitella teleta]|eukprot:ELU12062.1 hypothetical protein CAPTEDRAFT_219776 [Capitella teleta]